MSNVEKVSGYEIGKEYKTVTGISLLSMLLYCVAGMVALVIVISIISPNSSVDSNKMIGTSAFGAAMFVCGVWLNVVHKSLPHATYTVLNTYRGGDGLFKADLRYSDGTLNTRNLGIGGGFWEQFGGFLKANFSGK
jgi:hypothetical protein